ncbi:SRPBCC family protein [Spirillospora sp. NPDC047279]|uniref:SRPBCC family protein n=1 Tax=Spirillospora sp. NPDC047279 TaxID=3155478 RepID=UPI003400C0FF
MTPIPTGRLRRTADGSELVLSRTFKAPIEDVWASVTEPERTARWFGPWEGEPGAGNVIKTRMLFEEGEPWMEMRIEACEPPERLLLSADDESGGRWELEARLAEADGVTVLELIHHRIRDEMLGSMGPGWEYYLDMLVASREDTPRPAFEDYYPAQKDYFDGLA